MRKNSNDLQYMHNMETWLNQADYDKYARVINDSELHKHIIERERLKFYSLYPDYEEKQKIDMPEKIKEIEKCYKYKCCCCC